MFYKDGVLFSTRTTPAGALNGGYNGLVGSRSEYLAGEYMAAETDGIGVFSRTLNESEIQQIHQHGLEFMT